MKWEESKALTPLKRDFLHKFFEKETRFFLTGGSALGIFYLEHRCSYDLDLFTTDRFDWVEVDGWIRWCASEIRATITILKDAPTFRRYQMRRADESEILDFVLDAGLQVDPEKNTFDRIRVDTLHEIVVNKVTTLIGRCEVKDLVDLYFLEAEGFKVENYMEEAALKDGGLDPAMVAILLGAVKINEMPDYLLKPLSVDALRDYIDKLRLRMAALAYPSNSGKDQA